MKGGGEHYAKIYDAAHARDTVLCCNRRRTIRLRIGTRSTTFRKWIRDQIIRAVQDTHLITTSSFGGARKSRLTAHRSIMQLQTIMAKIVSFNRNIGNASFSICGNTVPQVCRREGCAQQPAREHLANFLQIARLRFSMFPPSSPPSRLPS